MYIRLCSHHSANSNDIDLKQWHATMDHIAAPIRLQFSINHKYEVIKTFTRDYEIVHWILNRKNRDCKFTTS